VFQSEQNVSGAKTTNAVAADKVDIRMEGSIEFSDPASRCSLFPESQTITVSRDR
jgi:hypothetical protein